MIRLGEMFTRSGRRTGQLVDEVDNAVRFLSKNQFGAILVFERSIALGSIVEGGVRLDAIVSARLVESIFYPNNPLHDLAVVVRGDRVLAANVQLPLADVGMVKAELGSRHRAAVGVTMETDAVVVVVSEERGTIRIAERGSLSPPIPADDLREELTRRLLATPATSAVATAPEPAAPEAGDAPAKVDASTAPAIRDTRSTTGAPTAEGA
jgi:diadenylate cyclase